MKKKMEFRVQQIPLRADLNYKNLMKHFKMDIGVDQREYEKMLAKYEESDPGRSSIYNGCVPARDFNPLTIEEQLTRRNLEHLNMTEFLSYIVTLCQQRHYTVLTPKFITTLGWQIPSPIEGMVVPVFELSFNRRRLSREKSDFLLLGKMKKRVMFAVKDVSDPHTLQFNLEGDPNFFKSKTSSKIQQPVFA